MAKLTLDEILNASKPAEVFDLKGDLAKQLKALQRVAHPDMNAARRSDATRAFTHLMELHKRALGLLGGGEQKIETKRASFYVGPERWSTSGVSYRRIKDREEAWFGYVSTPKATGRFMEGTRNLTAVRQHAALTKHEHFFPLVESSVKFGPHSATEGRVFASEVKGTRWFALDEFARVNPRDVGWIARRVFIALDLTHKAGYTHGSPHLKAILVEPREHGVMLKDWQYSVKREGENVTLVDSGARAALDIWKSRKHSLKDLDVLVAAHAFEVLLQKSSGPRWLIRFFQQLQRTPMDAHRALTLLTELLDEHWPREFHKMEYPA